MGNLFDMTKNRTILAANQNCFPTPIRHPSRLLNEHVISYVLQGGWELAIGEETIRPTKDHVFIQPANIAHKGLALCPPSTTTMFVHFSVEQGDRLIDEEAPVLPRDSVYMGNLIDASDHPDIKELLIKTIEETAKGESVKAAVYLNLLLCRLSESFGTRKKDYAVQIKQIIDQNKSQNLTNKEIAERLNISIRAAEYSFSARYHTTIHAYMLTQRIEQAKFWLEYYPNLKLSKISQDLGFYDEYHFSRRFKRETGVSPKQYREHVLATKNVP